MTKIWIIMIICVTILCKVSPVRPECDLVKAEVCVKEMEDILIQMLETTSGVGRTERLQHLCLDIIKGNNMTQCFINATAECPERTDAGPNSTVQRWERAMQQLYGLCDGACPDFLQRTVNITQCTAIIRFDALYDSSYQLFCSSINESMQCVDEVSKTCPEFGQLFFDLLPPGMEDTANKICSAGCEKFDEALIHLETCKKYVMEMPEDLDKACTSYDKFKTCIRLSEAPVTCPMFTSLMEVLYPQHIFGLYEQDCSQNLTQRNGKQLGNVDKCGAMGIARIDHCVRVFAFSRPADGKEDMPSKEQCKYFRTGNKCLENSGILECKNLREYFQKKIKGRQRQRKIMLKRCVNRTAESGSPKLSATILESLIFILLSMLLQFASN